MVDCAATTLATLCADANLSKSSTDALMRASDISEAATLAEWVAVLTDERPAFLRML